MSAVSLTQTCDVECVVNGDAAVVSVSPTTLLVDFLRDDLGLKGTNVGCDTTQCGACTILVDGMAVKSCTMLAVQASGRSITTIEGVAGPKGELHPVQQSFMDNHGLQCGYCTPGMVMSAIAMLSAGDTLTESDVRHRLEGNLCRCTGYQNIVKSIMACANGPSGN